jgi:hypothetical protein
MFYGYKNGKLVCTLQDSAVTTRRGMLKNGTADTFTDAPNSEPAPAVTPSAEPVLFPSPGAEKEGAPAEAGPPEAALFPGADVNELTDDGQEAADELTDSSSTVNTSTVEEAPPVKMHGKGKRKGR